jgi:hypothetical protein
VGTKLGCSPRWKGRRGDRWRCAAAAGVGLPRRRCSGARPAVEGGRRGAARLVEASGGIDLLWLRPQARNRRRTGRRPELQGGGSVAVQLRGQGSLLAAATALQHRGGARGEQQAGRR